MAGGVSPSPHPSPLDSHFYCFDIGSREPNYAVFQQNPTVVTAQLDAPMDPDAINSHAWSSTHLKKRISSVCRDRTALQRNPIRSLASRDPIAENHEKSMVFIEFLDDATRSSQTEKFSRIECIEESGAKFSPFAEIVSRC